MLLQELSALLPDQAPPRAVAFGITAVAIGAVLWLLAARFSRYVVPLLAVAIGGAVGMQLPHWLGWSISGAGTAVGAAVVLGVSGFILHGMWMGLGLGVVTALWVTVGFWIGTRAGHEWTWPAISNGATIASYAQELWGQLPETMTRILPFSAAASMITAMAMAIMWPRLTMSLMWSLTGLTLAVVGGLLAAQYGQPELLERVPETQGVQIAVLAGLLGIGASIQWKLAPASRGRRAKGNSAPSTQPAAT